MNENTVFPVCFSCADIEYIMTNQHYTGIELDHCLECGETTDGFIILPDTDDIDLFLDDDIPF